MSKRLVSLLFLGLGVVAWAAPTAFGLSIDVRISVGGDDFEENASTGAMDSGSSDLELPYENAGTPVGTTDQVIGLRFTPVEVPKGAQVQKAYVEFEMDETKGNTQVVNLIIEGELIANAPAFATGTKNITNRTRTKAQVKWTPATGMANDTKFQTADISSIIQEIVNQEGWATGNALVIIIRDDKSNPSAGVRCVEAVEGEPASAALLHIEVASPFASKPNPANGATGVGQPLLGWEKGDNAVFHNVYLGTSPTLTEANLVAKNLPFAMYYHVPGIEPGVTYYWRVDEMDAAGVISTGDVWNFMAEPIGAWGPKPANEAANLLPSQTLMWLPGKLVIQQQVFFSSSLAEVTNGAAAADKGKVTETKFNTGLLRSSTTYYWRVDEIQAGGTVNKGPVWSFTTADGVAKKIVSQWWYDISGAAITNLTGDPRYPANPSGSELTDVFEGKYVNSDIDNCGMRVYGWLIPPESGNYTFWIAADDNGELWLSTDADPANAKLLGSSSGADPRQWNATAGSAPLALQAGQKYFIMGLQANTGGRDHISVAWQGPSIPPQTILRSEYVDAFALPPLAAFSPTPANGEAEARQDGALSWNAGEGAQKHDVYFGDDQAAVAAADTSSPLYRGQQADAGFNAGALEWGKTYFWRVDEVDAAGAINAGPVWSFTAANFILVDNMEGYTDDEGSRIYETWIDGWTNNTGALVGNLTAPFAERTIVHGGNQSLPIDFDNSKAPFYSEAEQTFAPVQDWTINGVTDLRLFVRGVATNGDGAVYVAVEDSAGKVAVATNPDPALVKTTTWTEWKIPLSSLTGVNLAKVEVLYVGVGDRKSPAAGGTGRLYIDDIRVTKP
jgi:hypothetical protein